MASFDKVTTSSTPTHTLAPKPIATAPPPPASPFSGERFFTDGGVDDDEEEEADSEGGEEEDEDAVDAIDLTSLRRGQGLSAPETYASSSSSSSRHEKCYAPTFRRLDACGFGGEEEGSYWDVLRSHLSDPVTGALMDDAMILPCGHSYGRGGLQQVHRMKSCCKCSQPVSEDLIRPNFALRSAVQAFLHEEEIHMWKVSKRRRDRLGQDKGGYDDPLSNELLRNRASQFPLAISDRVIIKGNKRTPPRFVGRVAAVTAQCLNGWYVVKTLDNGESVKLQFGSLAKVSADQPINAAPTYPNWL